MYEILTSGERLRKVRKRYKLSQVEVAGEQLSRSLLSLIEKNKVKLMRDTAEKIVSNINNLLCEKNIEDHIKVEYLLETDREQIKVITEELRNKLKLISLKKAYEEELEDTIREIQLFISNNINHMTTDELCKIYETIADTYISLLIFDKARENMIKCIAYSNIHGQDVLRHYNKLIIATYRMGLFEDVICFSTTAQDILKINNNINISDMKAIYFNTSLSYSKLNRFEESMKYLDLVGNPEKLRKKQSLDIYMQRANIYMKQKRIDDAEYYFLKILDIALGDRLTEVSSLAYINLAQIEVEKGHCERANEYCELVLDLDVKDIMENVEDMYTIISVYIKIDKLEMVEKYYDETLYKIESVKNTKMLGDIILKLVSYFIEKEYDENLDRYINFLHRNNSRFECTELYKAFLLACNYAKNKRSKLFNYIEMATSISK